MQHAAGVTRGMAWGCAGLLEFIGQDPSAPSQGWNQPPSPVCVQFGHLPQCWLSLLPKGGGRKTHYFRDPVLGDNPLGQRNVPLHLSSSPAAVYFPHRTRFRNVKGKSVKKSRDWILEKKERRRRQGK